MCAACTSLGDEALAARGAPLIYGEDDRREVFEAAAVYDAARAVAAVLPRSRIRYGADHRPEIVASSLQATEGLCADQRYAEQPSAAECTAVLIDDNLLATAGHCFRHAWDCQNYVFVFGYFYAAPGELAPLEVYECRRAQVQENDLAPESALRDYAIIELTRAVEGRNPLAARAEPPSSGEPLTVISAGAGLPLKVDSGARALDARLPAEDYFLLDSDTFHGSSGAPVLDAQGTLAGVLARGNPDYAFDERAGCNVLATSPAPTLREEHADAAADAAPAAASGMPLTAEQASYLHPAIEALCERGYPSLRLCGIESRCGDGFCYVDESSDSCPHDCGAAQPPAPDAGRAPPRRDQGPTINEDADAGPAELPQHPEQVHSAPPPPERSRLPAPGAQDEHQVGGCSVRAGPASGAGAGMLAAMLVLATRRLRPRRPAGARPARIRWRAARMGAPGSV
jgi:hypothetical protein